MPDKSIKIVIDGKPVLGPTGETPSFHSDAIALSPDGEYLYYQPIAAKTLYRVRTDALRDAKGKPVPEKYAATFPVDGIWMDRKQNIYLSNLQQDGVSRLTPDRKIETLVKDPRLQWPDTFSEGPDGSIYITASHINESPTYNNGKTGDQLRTRFSSSSPERQKTSTIWNDERKLHRRRLERGTRREMGRAALRHGSHAGTRR